MSNYKSLETVQRLRQKQVYAQVDPILADLSKLILTGNFRPAIRKQVEANLESLGGYLKNQKRKAGLK
jgi:hypothetical protein